MKILGQNLSAVIETAEEVLKKLKQLSPIGENIIDENAMGYLSVVDCEPNRQTRNLLLFTAIGNSLPTGDKEALAMSDMRTNHENECLGGKFHVYFGMTIRVAFQGFGSELLNAAVCHATVKRLGWVLDEMMDKSNPVLNTLLEQMEKPNL